MNLTEDNKQRISTGLAFILEFYKILMGTFLIAFVPQKCDDHVCTLSENIYNTSTLHLVSNIYNLISFAFVINFYRSELKREHWCIKYLDIDHAKPNDNLDTQIEEYPKIKSDMVALNKEYLLSTYLALFFLITNFIISSVSIGYDYVGTNTLTSIISFFILVVTKVSGAYNVGKTSVHDERAFSAYMKTPVTYNVIDYDHVNNDDKYNHITVTEKHNENENEIKNTSEESNSVDSKNVNIELTSQPDSNV